MNATSSSGRLAPLQQMAEKREEAAAQRLREHQQMLAERERQLRELAQYADEYARPMTVRSAAQLLNQHQFVGRLREAVTVQQSRVEQARRDCEQERVGWIDRRREVATLEQLVEVYRNRERQAEERQHQKRLDEFALRNYCMREPDAGAENA